jgi:hypothetical protein
MIFVLRILPHDWGYLRKSKRVLREIIAQTELSPSPLPGRQASRLSLQSQARRPTSKSKSRPAARPKYLHLDPLSEGEEIFCAYRLSRLCRRQLTHHFGSVAPRSSFVPSPSREGVKVFCRAARPNADKKNAARHPGRAAFAINELRLFQLALPFLGKIEMFLDHL